MRRNNLLAVTVTATVLFVSIDPAQAQPRLEARISSQLEHSGDEIPPAFSPDGTILAVSDGTTLALWSVRNGKRLAVITTWRNDRITTIAISPDGTTVAAGGYFQSWKEGNVVQEGGRAVHLWDIASRSHIRGIRPPASREELASLCLSPDGKHVGYSVGNKVCINEVASGKLVSSVDCEYYPKAVRFDNTSRWLAIGGRGPEGDQDGRLTFLDIATSDLRQAKAPWVVQTIAFHPKTNLLYTASRFNDGHIRMWAADTAKEVGVIRIVGGVDHIQLAFNHDGRYVCCRGDNELLIYATDGDKALSHRVKHGFHHVYIPFAFSPAGDRLAVVGSEPITNARVIKLWSLAGVAAVGMGTLSAADQRAMEREIVFGEPIDAEYFEVFGKARYDIWKDDAGAGCKYGRFLLGCALLRGSGGVTNERRGLELISQAAADGNPMAEIFLASQDRQDPKKLFARYSQAAKGNHPLALEYLAGCYREGTGVEKDVARAFALSHAAADGEAGIAAAMTSVGVAYKSGVGVAVSPKQAIEWFQKAVAKGHPEACYHIGMCYLDGIGIEPDSKRAVALFADGVRKGNILAKMGLAFCKERGEGCQRDWEAALSLYQDLEKLKVKAATKKVAELKALLKPVHDAKYEAFLKEIGGGYQPLSAYRGGAASDIRGRAVYEAQQAAWEAQRDFRAHIGGQLGAQGFLPLQVSPPPLPPVR